MAKIKSLEELRQLRGSLLRQSLVNISADRSEQVVLAVGVATCGIAAGGDMIMRVLQEEIDKQHLSDRVVVVPTGCLGYCYAEPIVEVRAYNRTSILYGHVDEEKARLIIRNHIMKGEMLDNAVIGRGSDTI